MKKNRNIGDIGENYACRYLEKHGYNIIERNYRCKIGEIDIIARKKNILNFIEVRTKSSKLFGTPEESIVRKKKEKLQNLALLYLSNLKNINENDTDWRIGVVAVELDNEHKLKHIEFIESIA